MSKEAEAHNLFNVGDFTMDWVDFNSNPKSDIYASGYESNIIATYGVSPYWTNFKFREPSTDDVGKYWQDNFSSNLRPLAYVADLFNTGRLCCVCKALSACLSVCRVWFWSPDRLDVGHGFKLIRFFKLPTKKYLV